MEGFGLSRCILWVVLTMCSLQASSAVPRLHVLERQKRQVFIPPEYALGMNAKFEESGPWGPWSVNSRCSRSCGVGVSFQSRICEGFRYDGKRVCYGPSRRYHTCNIQPCPVDRDFRVPQCSRFNSVPSNGNYYSWVPFYGAPNPCELNCMPKGSKYYHRKAVKVIDGTPCYNNGSNHICIVGTCIPLPCDKILGSDAKVDKCGVCGGDNSTCRIVSGIARSEVYTIGYNDILIIPPHSMGIIIEEVTPNDNFLAIRNLTGYYYLNGDYGISYSGTYMVGGVEFHYERNYDFTTPERIWSEGPTLEPLYITVLYQDHTRNPDIRYEYAVPIDKEITPAATYSWKTEEYQECSKTCGGGEQQRSVHCVRSSDGVKVEDSLCDIVKKPEQSKECNTHPCPALWYTGEWSQCSHSCASGVQYRVVYCQQIIQGGILAVTNDQQCEQDDDKPKPPFFQTCNEDVECPRWHSGPWTACNRICGPGNQTREVTCEKGKQETIVLDSSSCDIEKMPPTVRNCTVRPCEGLEWILTEWSGCTDKCGPQRESRQAYCANEKGEVFPDDLCSDKPVPELSRPCPKAKPCIALWHTSEWSRCSAKCGTGVQTRVVFCGIWKGDSVRKVSDKQCKKEKKFTTVRNCTRIPCKGSWFSGPWTKCSASCGGGERTRKILCLHKDTVVSATQCDPSIIPYSNETCNEHPCVEDVTTEAARDCTTSLYGCCPDGKTVAAPNIECPSEDCGPFGCCLDMKTPATGPFKAGCPEITLCGETKYGCCADGLTAAKGEHYEGCPDVSDCVSSTYGCCSDNVTAAKGPAMEGCFPDNVTEATALVPTIRGTTLKIIPTTFTSFPSESVSPSSETPATTTPTVIESSSTTAIDKKVTSLFSTSVAASFSTETMPMPTTAADVTSSGRETKSSTTEMTTIGVEISTTEGTVTPSSMIDTASTSAPVAATKATTTTETTEMTTIGVEISTTEGTVTPSSMMDTSSTSAPVAATKATTTTETPVVSEMQTTAITSSETSSAMESTTLTGTMTTSKSSVSETTMASTITTTVTTSTGKSTFPETTSSATTSTVSSTGTLTPSDSVATSHTVDFTTHTAESFLTSPSTVSIPSETAASLTTGTLSTSLMSTTDLMPTSDSTETTHDETKLTSTEPSLSTAITTPKVSVSLGTTPTGTMSVHTSSTTGTEDTTAFAESLQTSSTIESSVRSSITQTTVTSGPTTTVTGSVFTSSQSDSTLSDTAEVSTSQETATGSSVERTLPVSSTLSVTPIISTLLSDKSTTETTLFDNVTESLSATSEFQNLTSTVSVSCHDTKFGCCSDNMTASTDENGSNCPIDGIVVNLENITQSDEASESICADSGYNGSSICCESSQYGCCPDNVTAATGEGFKGCFKSPPEELRKEPECEKSTYGCCPDGVAPALDENYVGCPCETFQYGCCNDSITPQLGPDDEGCCFTSEFGCCPDNKTVAEREDFIGCPCSTLPDGCCRDNILPAIGPNQEGCDCELSSYGCCEDGFTMPTGSDFEGCICNEMLYGCCPDNFTAAQGPYGEGCRCDQSRHGCCPDGQTTARGPEYFGCPCSTLPFGCCADGKTPAFDKEKNSCPCNTTEYGCCPNGVTHATGPDLAGCPCETTKFGCCADGKTAAVGFYGAGCEDCSKLAYGCCPDNKTVAKGKDYDGCPCSTFPFGCCPDRHTPAHGPNNEGCSCGFFGCCHDGRTPAKGPNYYGCPCGQYGCCPDGTPAKGPNNYGCSCGQYGCCPNSLIPALGPNGTGCPCDTQPFGCCPDNKTAAMGPSYFGCSCKTMVYGCCSDGITPAKGPSGEGCSCESSQYGCCPDNITPAKGRNYSGCPCNSFPYGCCPDNHTVATGPSNAGCSCRTMQYGCCYDGVTPAVGPDYEGCPCNTSQYGCCPDGITPALGEKHKGCSCLNTEFGCCDDGYTAASGLNNEGCPTDSPGSDTTGRCNLPMVTGPCSNYTHSWYFNATINSCVFFWYGGCGGNENRFKSEEDCDKSCMSPPSKDKDVCQLPLEIGHCQKFRKRWYYDAASGKCKQFSYSSCGGNNNNFGSYKACLKQCGMLEATSPPTEEPKTDRCLLPKDPGLCSGQLTSWYYDSKLNVCRKFKYSGCGGNRNRFQARKTCESVCVKKIPKVHQTTVAPSSESNADVCQMPPDQGNCDQSLPRWFYDAKSKTCLQFIYSGCGGNKNHFKTAEVCMNFCSKTSSVSVPDIKTKDCPPSNCDELLCPLSKDVKVDERGCSYCECFNPCEIHVCPEEHRCAIEMYRTDDGEVRAQPLCRLIRKPGECPTVENKAADLPASECRIQCRLDSDCRNNRKCCFNGCTEVCMDPVLEVVDSEHGFDKPTEQDIVVKVGDPVFLVCPALPSMSYHWSRNNASLPDDDPHIQIFHNGTVYISSVEENDTSMFICTTPSSTGSHIKHKFNVLVQVPARILPGPVLVIVQQFQPATLQCKAIGYPQPVVTWWKEQRMLPTSSRQYHQYSDYSLLIRRVSFPDVGLYSCQAYNGIGSMAILTITVRITPSSDVAEPFDFNNKQDGMHNNINELEGNKKNEKQPDYGEPTSPFLPPRGILYSTGSSAAPVSTSTSLSPIVYKAKIIGGPIFYMKSGDTFNLTCVITQVSSLLPSYIYWYQNGSLINSEPERSFSVITERKHTETESTLLKINAHPMDSGNYTCSIQNAEHTVVVHVSTADLSVEINEVTPPPKIGNLMQLDCIANGPPSLTVRWYFNNSFVQEDERIRILPNNTLIVSDIQISHSGRYQCVARDNENEASASVTVAVKADVPEDCIDSPSFADCELIVKANYCANLVFGAICCHSCTLAGHPPQKS